jgi:fructose-bisphosphate aldolase class 1
LEDYGERILALVAEQPDRTLDEIVAAMRKPRIPGTRSALWRSLIAMASCSKKACGQPSSTEQTGASAAALNDFKAAGAKGVIPTR